jgi:acetyl esterase
VFIPLLACVIWPLRRQWRALLQQKVPVPCAGDVTVRCYYPTSAHVDLPVILFFHAGGWVIGNLETHDALCRRIAKQTGVW